MGRQWYEDGKMMKKKNTFTDFIDCGEYLVKEGYTSKGHLYAQGGSAGTTMPTTASASHSAIRNTSPPAACGCALIQAMVTSNQALCIGRL